MDSWIQYKKKSLHRTADSFCQLRVMNDFHCLIQCLSFHLLQVDSIGETKMGENCKQWMMVCGVLCGVRCAYLLHILLYMWIKCSRFGMRPILSVAFHGMPVTNNNNQCDACLTSSKSITLNILIHFVSNVFKFQLILFIIILLWILSVIVIQFLWH